MLDRTDPAEFTSYLPRTPCDAEYIHCAGVLEILCCLS
jgi:hypothetical protein